MKLKLTKKKLKVISNNKAKLPAYVTPNVGGGVYPNTVSACGECTTSDTGDLHLSERYC
ncbi:hypothetical protein [Pseudoalteromonas sp. MMG022]|uniref:hypothetical protein n=1 Tax=Pseudoalteromonas sp. MMG022 TaxID=2909978 RepID=UPI001F1942FF|nr:hypothetical protein [Pseudoalteromonas sp. MMG022]MCF6436615.1 hypothetical protein [Pseudoalteromonas sp. MMG022]